MFRRIIATTDDRVLALLRITLGVVYFPHGAQKVLGWFGGYGFTGTMHFFTDMQHIPYVFGVLAIAAEFLGSIGLIVGFLGRIAAFGIACEMLTAVYLVHYPNGFFMNWAGTQKGEGFEYHILAIVIALVIMIRGSGAFSIDHALSEREFRSPVL
jgi:putative oxidoreductase